MARSVFTLVVLPFALLGILEVVAYAPIADWLDPRLWLVHLLGTVSVATAVWLLTLVIHLGLRGLKSARLTAGDIGLWLATLVIGTVELWSFAASRLRFGGEALRVLVLTAALSLGYLIARRLAERLKIDDWHFGIGLATTFGTVILYDAVRRALSFSGGYPPAKPLVLVAASLYLLASVAIWLWGRARRGLWTAALLLLGVALLRVTTTNPFELHAQNPPGTSTSTGPSVLLIVLDTFRADALDLREGPDGGTPNLARFAHEADVYTNAIANASWSLPGHASIFTGQPLARHRTDLTSEPGFRTSLPRDVPIAQELFKAKGYRTSCVTGNHLIEPGTGLARGFQRYRHVGRGWMNATIPVRLVYMVSPSSLAYWIYDLMVEWAGLYVNARAQEIVDYAIQECTGKPRGFYLFLNFMDTHRPYPIPRDTPLRARVNYDSDLLAMLAGRLSPEAFGHRSTDLFRAAYREQARGLDSELGRLFQTLRQQGWYDDMLIVVMADHGEAFWENPQRELYFAHHGAYEPVVRIPLMIKRPGQHQGAVFHHYVQQVDVLPALLSLAGLPALPGLGSAGLESGAAREPIVTEWYPRLGSPDYLLPRKRIGLYTDAYKYVEEGGGREYLFDLQRSPWEAVDAIDREPRLAAASRETLLATLREQQAGARGGDSAPLDQFEQERLRALGYIN